MQMEAGQCSAEQGLGLGLLYFAGSEIGGVPEDPAVKLFVLSSAAQVFGAVIL